MEDDLQNKHFSWFLLNFMGKPFLGLAQLSKIFNFIVGSNYMFDYWNQPNGESRIKAVKTVGIWMSLVEFSNKALSSSNSVYMWVTRLSKDEWRYGFYLRFLTERFYLLLTHNLYSLPTYPIIFPLFCLWCRYL